MSAGELSNSASEKQDTVATALPARPRASWPLVLLATIAVIAVLYVARDIAIPLVLAVMLALLLRPIFRRLQKLRVPNVIASLLPVLTVAVLFLAGMVTVARQGQAWLAKAPETVQKVQAMLPHRQGPLGDLAKATEAVKELAQPEAAAEKEPVPVVMQSSDAAISILGTSGHFLGATLIVFVLAFFLLCYSDTLLRQAIESRSSFSDKKTVVALLYHVESGISTYLATVTIINIGLGIVTAIVLWVIDVPNPVLWGLMATVLNFVPHIGALVCEVVLFFVAAVYHESLWYGLGAAASFFALTTIESYLVTPLVLSKRLELSPLAVILSVLLVGWLWGVAGGLMAAPLLAIAKIVCDEFPALRPIGMVLSGESKTANQAATNGASAETTRPRAEIPLSAPGNLRQPA
jgi:predicted PurR-regulated permease PerM